MATNDDGAGADLDRACAQRLQFVLGVIGDAAPAPRPFDELSREIVAPPEPAQPSVPRRRRLAVVAAAVLIVGLTGVVVGWRLSARHHGRVVNDAPVTSDTSSAATTSPDASVAVPTTATAIPTSAPTSTPTSAPTSTPTSAASSWQATEGVVGPWYSLDVAGFEAGAIATTRPESATGAETTVWVGDGGSFQSVLVMHRFATDSGFTTLTGTERNELGPVPGTLYLVSDPDDPLDPDSGTLRGNEMRWELDDGEVLEFSSYGIRPGLLDKSVRIVFDAIQRGCPCEVPGLDIVAVGTADATLDRQQFTSGDTIVTLARSDVSPAADPLLGDVGSWRSVESRVVDGYDGIVIDGTRAVWQRDGYWFGLGGASAGEVQAALDSLRSIGSAPAALPGAAVGLTAGWNRLSDSPLSPRTGATAVWTGSEVVVVGGSANTCPAGADCAAQFPNLADGAAYDPAAGTWRPIADAPISFTFARAVALHGDVYLLDASSGDGSTLLRYRPDTDAWSTIAGLPADAGTGLLPVEGVGGRLVVYHLSDERDPGADWDYNADGGAWTALPDDGMPPSYDRQIVESETQLFLVAKRLPAAGSSDLADVMVATFWFGGGAWTPVPASHRSGFQAWHVGGQIVVNPHFGGAAGGVLSPASLEWSDLPDAPDDPSFNGDLAGAFSDDESAYESTHGWTLDVGHRRWVRIPQLDQRDSAAATAVGRNLFVFGGQIWTDRPDGELRNDAWIWVPPTD